MRFVFDSRSSADSVGEMKVPESGMPDEAFWESLLDVNATLDRFTLIGSTGPVAELGCGYGTFTLPVARGLRGHLYTFDIERDMVERTQARLRMEALSNVTAEVRDVVGGGFGLEDGSCAACLLFNILHLPDPERLLAEAARIVRPGGFVAATHWRSDISTPRGPPLEIRPRPEHVK